MKTRRRIPVLAGLLAPVLAVPLGLTAAQPAQAATPQEFSAVVGVAAQQLLSYFDIGWRISCTVDGGTLNFAGAPTVGLVEGTGSQEQIYRRVTPSSWIGQLGAGMPYGLTPTNKAKVLKRAQMPAGTVYMSGPWEPWVERYADIDTNGGFDKSREGIAGLALVMQVPSWYTQPGVTLTFVAGSGKSGTWTLSAPGKSAILTLDSNGAIETSVIDVNGSITECQMENLGIIPVVPKPSGVGPVKSIGPAAWWVSNSTTAGQLTSEIGQAVIASGQYTGDRVRAQTWISLDANNLVGIWKVANISRGTRIWRSDPLAGMVQRCITAQKGKVSVSAC